MRRRDGLLYSDEYRRGERGRKQKRSSYHEMDVIIIGGGVCGCALLYELSRYNIKTVLLEQENDVACGASKANSALVHAGYDPEPNTAMARYNVEGRALIEKMSADLDILYKKTGSLVVGFDETDRQNIEKLLERGNKNGVPELKIISGEELFNLEPNLSREVICALYAPSAGIISPWELVIAQAECAIQGGAKIELSTKVTGIEKVEKVEKVEKREKFAVKTSKGVFQSRFVVNAAGVNSDIVSEMIDPKFFTITPKRGEYFILDTTEAKLLNMVVFPCPSKLGKGVLAAPTVHGNIILGPNSTDCARDATENTAAGLEYVKNSALRCIPSINFRASIRNFSGVRANSEIDDFIIGESARTPGFFNMAGIKSPGLTSAPAIAKDVARMLLAKGLSDEANPAFVATRNVKRFKYMNSAEKAQAIKDNPLYGTIVCRCETVTEGEMIDAMKRPLPPRSIDAMKRRVTSGMGRCQGGFCGPRVQAIIAKHAGCPEEEIPLDTEGMYIITGETKSGGCFPEVLL